jgi:hypothetical protein
MLLALLAAGITSPVMFALSLILAWLGGLLGGIVAYSEQVWAVMFYTFVPLIGLIYAYVLGRISLILPGTAIDQHLSLRRVWALSENNDLRLMALVGLSPAISLAVGALLDEVVFAGNRSLLLAFSSLLGYVTIPFEISILSLTFRELSSPQRLILQEKNANASI